MEDETLAEDSFEVKDSNGNILQNGDTVLVIKDLKVKGGSTIKRGTKVRDIRLSDEAEGVTGKIDGMKGIYLRPEYVKKAQALRYLDYMSHPFEKMFDRAIKKSTPLDNAVLNEAEKLREKGYSPEEIMTVLRKLHKSLIDKDEAEVVGEAVEEFSRYVDE